MKHLVVLAVCSGLFAAPTIAMAQDTSGYPDMRGQWKGPTDAVVLGRDAFHHHDAKGNASEPRTSQTEFTFTIKGQDGRKFWGEVSSKETAEPVVGVFASDKQTVHWVDTDGYAVGKLLGRDKFEYCYLRPGKDFMAAGCSIWTKQGSP
jgi:hypothetical protein